MKPPAERGATLAHLLLVLVVAGFLGLGACGGGGAQPPTPPTVAPPPFALGDPIDGLTPDELASFHRGKALFTKRFRPSGGLGPFYNATSCASCHSTPIVGGSARLYRNFYLAVWGPEHSQSVLPPYFSQVIQAYGSGANHLTATFTFTGGRPVIPQTYLGFPVVQAQRNALSVFGVGLFEFISNDTIMANADPDDTDGDGISGRYNTDAGALGRFGAKAQSNNIERFTRGPLQNQMGVTSNPFLGSPGTIGGSLLRMPQQVSAHPDDPTYDADSASDPEIGHWELGDLIAFTRFLAPPRRQPFDDAARRGEATFDQVGCTRCHIPSLPSSRGSVDAYTDLLLHDMGAELADGLSFGEAQVSSAEGPTTGSEWRTSPLWGVSLHAPFLHDGRAATLLEAILLHAGEADAVLEAFLALSSTDRGEVIHFLEQL